MRAEAYLSSRTFDYPQLWPRQIPQLQLVQAVDRMAADTSDDVAQIIRENGGMGATFYREEGPRRLVTIAKPFAVGKFTVTIR